MRLSALLAALPSVQVPPGTPDPEITGLTADSRQVTAGSLFVAVPGEYFDGRRFIADALARGAAAVVAEAGEQVPPGVITVPDAREALAWLAAAWHGFPSQKLVLAGVTGTDGKTTTASLLHSILLAAGHRAGLVSTVSAVIGDESLDTGFHVTTPDALTTQALLARMVAAGLTHAVLEVTSHGLAQHRVTGCAFDVAVITNITHEHLDFHKTYEHYRAAKGRLFTSLLASPAKPRGAAKTAILNADDASYAYLAGLLEPAPAVRRLAYGLTAAADYFADDVRYTPAGTTFTVRGPGGLAQPVQSTLVGSYNVSNTLAAVAAAVGGLGVAPEAAAQGVAALPGVPGRMERLDLGQPFTAIVDFAHTPNALRRVLITARQLSPMGRLIAVFGSAGLRDVEKRRLMAATAAELADLTILTAEDPRTEALADILEMMAGAARMQGGVEGQTFFRVPDRGAALRLAVSLAQPGDLVLACGKGHEQSMAFGATEYAWDDRTALHAALAERLGVPGPAMPYLPTQSA